MSFAGWVSLVAVEISLTQIQIRMKTPRILRFTPAEAHATAAAPESQRGAWPSATRSPVTRDSSWTHLARPRSLISVTSWEVVSLVSRSSLRSNWPRAGSRPCPVVLPVQPDLPEETK